MRALLVVGLVGCGAPTPGPATPPKWVEDTSVHAAPEQVTPPAFRLPGDVRPVRYDLDLTVIPRDAKSAGKVHIDAKVVRATNAVWLHAQDLEIGTASIDGAPVRVIKHEAMIGLVAKLEPGDHKLDLAFTTPIDKERSRGLYSVKESDGDDYAYTFFEPTDARRAFPCFDEPEYKVPWKLTFHVTKAHHALANAPVVSETDEANGMKRVELAETKPLPSYLVAYIVGPFELVDGGTGGRVKTPIRFAIPKGRSAELRWAKQVTPKVVTELENYFDMDYPYGKLDVAVVPRFWGTMEHPGIVAMGQPLTLIRPEQETRERKQRYANILAHELGHYWFGDLVTMKWWDDTWLNEALGEWMDMIITHATEPAWRYRDSRAPYAAYAMENDETLSTRQIRQPVTTDEQIESVFDSAITYAKGSALFRMIENYVGADNWRAFIRAYMKKHMWGNASADDFLSLASSTLGPPIEASLRSFLEQPGLPRISVSCAANKLTIQQTRALPAGTVDPKPKMWKLPVCLRYGDAKASGGECVFLDGASATIDLRTYCPSWTIVNADGYGYYRSVIDPVVAEQLLAPASALAKKVKPTPSEKLMMWNDLLAMVRRDELTVDRVLAVLPTLVEDPDDKIATGTFDEGLLRFDILDDADFAKAQRYAQKTYGPTARKLGWTRAKGDSDERHARRRNALWIAAGHDAALAAQGERLAIAWLDKRTGIEDDLVPIALAIYVQRGGFDRVLAEARKPRDRTELARLLAALGATRDPVLANRAFELVRSKELDLRDALPIVYGLLANRETRAATFALVKTHLDELLKRMRDDEASWFLTALAGGACDAGVLAELEPLLMPRATKIGGAKPPVDRGLEKSAQCIAAAARQRPALKKFLAAY